MNHFAKDRDRLLQSAARLIGLGSLALSLICAIIPGVLELSVILSALPLYALVAVALFRSASRRALVWVVAALLSGLAIQILVFWPLEAVRSSEFSASMVLLAGGSMAAFSFVLLSSSSILRMTIWCAAVFLSVTFTSLATPDSGPLSAPFTTVFFGWMLAATATFWIRSAVPPAARRIASIGRAHRAERHASETEAQRRQSARLLHDTVLATLTMLAHSGVGVSASALQHQAGDDARLLRQLRLGGTPVPQSTAHYNLEPVEESELGRTLESVKNRFGRVGLEVTWHGTGQILLPSHVLDAMLLALTECLENVRRHSGVSDAHVTITDDEFTVRAMVTDTGIGFVLGEVDPARLGFQDSVVNRLRDVGGTARLFSSPGAGTTVVLEVPR
ncbi:MAG: histidine kinase [Microbacteriaceae bacterium]|nr:histidine kinase [Microbacteriaceae bacterium]